MKKITLLLALIILGDLSYADDYKLQSSVFGSGTNFYNSNYIVRGTISQANIGKISSGDYTMNIGFWYNYLLKTNSLIIAPISTPTIQASNIQFSNISRTGMTVRWTRGNGEGSLLLARESYKTPNAPLIDRVSYIDQANSNFSAAPTIQGAKILYSGSSTSPTVNVTNLTKYKLMYFKVCEYNNVLTPLYLQTENSSNPASRWTLRRDGLAEEDLTIDAEYPYPNPVSSSITTTLDVFEAGNITAYLFDNSGKQIAELYNKYHEFGTFELIFDLSQIAQGAYQLVINKGREAIVYPISIIR
jgi:hypothetical protein